MRGIAFNRLNEIGDEVASSCKLRGYGLPRGVAAIRFGNDAIVECDEVSEYGNYQDKYYKCRNGERTSHGSSLGVRYVCSFELDWVKYSKIAAPFMNAGTWECRGD